MAIKIGDAVLKLGLDTKDFDAGMKNIKHQVKQHQKAIGIGMVAAGGTILAVGALSVKTYAKMGDEVQKMALRTGFSTEALSELRHAAQISGASLATLEKGVKRMAGTVLDAQDGLETYVRAFRHIGIEVEELAELGPEEQFLRIAEAIAQVEDPTKRAAIAQDIFGRAGTELLPLFAAGAEGLKELREEAHRLGVVFDQEAADKAAKMTDAMTRVGESISGLKMVIADKLIPVLLPMVEKIKEIISGMSAWMKEHPKLTRVIVIGTAILGGLLVAMGMLLLLMPGITAATAAFGITLNAAIWPITLVAAAIAGLITVGVLLWKNWQKVVDFFKKAWINIKIFFLRGVESILKALSKFTSWIPWLGDKIDEAREKISNMIDAEQIKKDALEVEKAAGKLTDVIKKEVEEQRDAKLEALADEREAVQAQYDDAIKNARETYGVLEGEDEDYQETKLDAAKRATEEQRKQYDIEIEEARKVTSEKLKLIDEEYTAKLKLLDDETAAIISEYQRQIDAIDEQTELEERAAKEAERIKRLEELKGAVESAETEDSRLEALDELREYEAKLERDRELEARRDEKNRLRDSIDNVRTGAAERRKILEQEREEKEREEEEALLESLNRLEREKDALDGALAEELLRIDDERQAYELAELEKLTASLKRLDDEEQATKSHYEKQLTEAELQVAAINRATAELQDRVVTITTVHRDVFEQPAPDISTRVHKLPTIPTSNIPMSSMAASTTHTGATIPLSQLQNIINGKKANIYVELDGQTIASAIGEPLVEEIRMRTGMKF